MFGSRIMFSGVKLFVNPSPHSLPKSANKLRDFSILWGYTRTASCEAAIYSQISSKLLQKPFN